jgi:hypothetical protein
MQYFIYTHIKSNISSKSILALILKTYAVFIFKNENKILLFFLFPLPPSFLSLFVFYLHILFR